jgi:hypothetical protein
MSWMIKDSVGRPSATLTFATVSLVVMIFCIVAPMFSGMTIHGFTLNIKPPDTTLLMGTLGASFLSYVTRRNKADDMDKDDDDDKGKKNV